MKCSKCGDFRETAADVMACNGCQDGTAQQIPPSIDGDTPLIEVCEHLPGLANRFVPGSAPPPEETRDEQVKAAEPAAKTAKPARKKTAKRATN